MIILAFEMTLTSNNLGRAGLGQGMHFNEYEFNTRLELFKRLIGTEPLSWHDEDS